MPSKVWDEIAYPFPNFNGGAVEVWEWISYFIPHFVMYVIIYSCGDLVYYLSIFIKRVPGRIYPDSKVQGANMGPTWVLSAPDGPHVGPMNLAIRVKITLRSKPICHSQSYAIDHQASGMER